MMCIAGLASSAEEYTIQTISALKESSITPAFEKKVQKSALASDRKKEGACNIVTVGRYGDVKTARANLQTAKTIAKDAFIRPLSREIPKACDPMTAKGQGIASVKNDMNASVGSAVSGTASVKVSSKASAVSASSAVSSADAQPSHDPLAAASVPQPPITQTEEKGCSPFDTMQTAVWIYDRNLARKRDIHEAIEYYKNSPYHSFRPVAMQSSSPKGL